MWTVILHFNRGNVETMTFEKKADALKCVDIVVFKNEDCINCSIFKDTRSALVKSKNLLKQESVEKIISKV